ncbi:MAG: hypothetical protein JWR02_3080 [Mucilaginibacter sp.]|nr:hypothetical protein [Mucilaginibacter sp.]
MVRTTLIPDNTHIELDIPAEYVGREIEITYAALDEKTLPSKKKTMADFLGILSDKSAKELHAHVKKIRNEWERGI